MAPKRTAKKPRAAVADRPLTAEDVRTAVLHLTELAAAFEGHGAPMALQRGKREDVLEWLGWEPVDEDESFAEDLRCLTEVVRKLARHRRRQQHAQRNAFLDGLQFALAAIYRRYRYGEASALDLQNEVTEALNAFGLHAGETELDALVLDKEDLDADEEGKASSIQGMEGPAEAAKKALSSVVGLSLGTLAEAKRWAHPLAFARRPLGRLLPRQARLAYVRELHETLVNETDRMLRFEELKDLGEPAARVLDRWIEGLHLRAVLDPRWRRVLTDPARAAKLASIPDAEVEKSLPKELRKMFGADLDPLPQVVPA